MEVYQYIYINYKSLFMASSTDQRRAKKVEMILQNDMIDTGNLFSHTSAITHGFQKYLNHNSFPCPRILLKRKKLCLWCCFLQGTGGYFVVAYTTLLPFSISLLVQETMTHVYPSLLLV